MMDWLSAVLKLPHKFHYKRSKKIGGGCTHNSASDAIFTTIVSARDDHIKKNRNNDDPKDHPASHIKNLQCYVSSEGHSCVEKCAQIAMVSIRKVQANENHQMTGAELEKAIEEDKANGIVPVYCCATLGTPGTCAFDDLNTIGEVCKKHGLWLHVDAAYAGNAFLAPDLGLNVGLEHADSIVVNPYKLMLGAADLSCLFFADCKRYIEPFVIDATYLIRDFEDQIDFRHYGVALSRRMRTLKLWFLFECYGADALREHILEVCTHAKTFADKLKEDARFEIINEVKLGIICFRQKV